LVLRVVTDQQCKMINITLYFIPGAAGNFFSRCLNLLENAYCFVDPNNPRGPTTLTEKMNLLTYDKVKNRKFNGHSYAQRNSEDDWVNFEDKLSYYEINPDIELPNNSINISLAHPHPNYLKLHERDTFFFYIDSSDEFEWCLLNAFYKNSFVDIASLFYGKELKNNPAVHKISLSAIIKNKDSFIKEFKRVCNIFGYTLQEEEELSIILLYQQWKTTVLEHENFKDFKDIIGFNL